MLGVGNEVDVRFEEHPGERDAYVRFVEAARERVHAVEPRLAVGVTLTGGAVRWRSRTYRALREVADVVPFNHAPIRFFDISDPDEVFTVRDLDRVRADLREVLDAYGEGPVVIQELTCPSAETMGGLGGVAAGVLRVALRGDRSVARRPVRVRLHVPRLRRDHVRDGPGPVLRRGARGVPGGRGPAADGLPLPTRRRGPRMGRQSQRGKPCSKLPDQ